MYKLEFEKRFVLKMEEIINYISLDNYEKAIEVKDFIFDYVKILQYYPLMWRKLDGVYRQIVLPNYKYKIVYKIDKENKTIFLYSIWREQAKF